MAVVRILRILEYVGEQEEVECHLSQCFVRDTVHVGGFNHEVIIREALLFRLPEMLGRPWHLGLKALKSEVLEGDS